MLIFRTATLLILSATFCLADGGAIIARQTLNGLDLTVFASPAPLRAGPVDVSVLVQDEKTGKPVLDAVVEVSWSSISSSSAEWLPPCCTMTTSLDKIPAQRGHSQNKFLYSAIVPIRSSGSSEFLIRTKIGEQEAVISCDIEAGSPRPPAMAYWPFLAFPPVLVGLFSLHQRLTKRSR